MPSMRVIRKDAMLRCGNYRADAISSEDRTHEDLFMFAMRPRPFPLDRACPRVLARPAVQGHACAAAAVITSAVINVIVGDLEAVTVQLGNRGNDGQAQSVTRDAALAIRRSCSAAIEAPQHGLPFAGWNSRSAVEHVNARARRLRAGAQFDLAMRWCELDRVVDKIADRFKQQMRIGLQRRQGSGGERE